MVFYFRNYICSLVHWNFIQNNRRIFWTFRKIRLLMKGIIIFFFVAFAAYFLGKKAYDTLRANAETVS